jgi:hypothetical protein
MDFYPYPPANTARIDPFDVKRKALQYIVFGGSRSTYAFTDPVASGSFFMADWIPMGYKVLEYAHKAAVFNRGELAREWSGDGAGPAVGGVPMHPDAEKGRKTRPAPSSWQLAACGYRVAVPSGERQRIGYDRDEALAAGARASSEHGLAAVWFVYEVQDWH